MSSYGKETQMSIGASSWIEVNPPVRRTAFLRSNTVKTLGERKPIKQLKITDMLAKGARKLNLGLVTTIQVWHFIEKGGADPNTTTYLQVEGVLTRVEGLYKDKFDVLGIMDETGQLLIRYGKVKVDKGWLAVPHSDDLVFELQCCRCTISLTLITPPGAWESIVLPTAIHVRSLAVLGHN